MLTVAIIVWCGAWLGSRLASDPTLARMHAAVLPAVMGTLSALLICPPIWRSMLPARSRDVSAYRRQVGKFYFLCFRGIPTVMTLCAAFAASTGCSLSWSTLRLSDATFILAAQESGASDVTIHVRSPVTVSPLRSSKCTADVLVTAVASGKAHTLILPSRFSATIYGDDPVCALQRDALYSIQAELGVSSFDGGVELRHSTDAGAETVLVAEASIWWRSMAYVQQRFLSVTSRLGEQGRVLVPGLTMGVLGQETIIDASGGQVGVDAAYARGVKEAFTRSGIMHLMVVSGGHFLLLSALVRWVANRIRPHPVVTAVTSIVAVCILVSAVYPSDAVWRAAVMSVLGVVSGLLGRRAQAISQLSWTVILMLFAQPRFADSYGFAFSCAAVLGIALAERPLAGQLEDMLGKAMAGLIATTLSAQAFTLPIQLLIESEIPVFSVPANLLVAPVIDLATMFGLIALGSAWLLPELAYACAWLSSVGTSLMYDCARWLGGTEFSTVGWLAGVRGVVLMVVVECLLLALVVSVHRLYAKACACAGEEQSDGSFAYRRSIRSAVAFWVRESREMFDV